MAYILRVYSGPLLLAFLVHATVLAALYGGWSSAPMRPVQAFKPQMIESQLIVMQPKAKPKPPTPTPPKPAVAPPVQPKLQPKPAVKPAAVDLEAERLRRQRAEQQRRLAELAQLSFEQALESEAAQLAEDEHLAVAQGFRFGIYQRVVSNWSRPPSARNGMEARLLVELIPTGAVIGVTVVESSGNKAFDRSAEAAVRKARVFDVPQEVDVFERHFRRFSLLFKPEDLLR